MNKTKHRTAADSMALSSKAKQTLIGQDQAVGTNLQLYKNEQRKNIWCIGSEDRNI